MRLIPFNEDVLEDLISKGYREFNLKSQVEPQDGGYYQDKTIQVYEAYIPTPVNETKDTKLKVLKDHLQQHAADCYVILRE